MAEDRQDGMPWHAMTAEAVLNHFGTDAARGLGEAEARSRHARFGANELQDRTVRGPRRLALAQFTNFMTLVLVAAAAVAGAVGDGGDSIAIIAVVILNAIVGFVQEYRAENTLAALRRMSAGQAMVVRDGTARAMPAGAVVPGDIVLLEAGNTIPADLRLVETHSLKLGEAALTGESLPVEKSTAPLADRDLVLGDRVNIAFRGTTVLFGRARGGVVATEARTELGRIAAMLRNVPETDTPLQRRLSGLGRHLALAAIAICGLILAIGLLRGEPPLRMLLTALSLAVAAIPEALPAVVTALLALGARRMADSNALIRRLPAVETLGSVTVICSDKTGTLTENRMRATEAQL
jgi:Ca2+-transporting ATPase